VVLPFPPSPSGPAQTGEYHCKEEECSGCAVGDDVRTGVLQVCFAGRENGRLWLT